MEGEKSQAEHTWRGRPPPVDEERRIVSRKWEEPLVCGLSWPIITRMSHIPQPFCEANSSSELARLVCPLKENHVKPIKRIYTVKGGDNALFQLPLNFDEYGKQS